MGLKKRSQDDEDLMDAIAKTTPDKQKMYIIDVRPRVSLWCVCVSVCVCVCQCVGVLVCVFCVCMLCVFVLCVCVCVCVSVCQCVVCVYSPYM